jgi:hypothetical protein
MPKPMQHARLPHWVIVWVAGYARRHHTSADRYSEALVSCITRAAVAVANGWKD